MVSQRLFQWDRSFIFCMMVTSFDIFDSEKLAQIFLALLMGPGFEPRVFGSGVRRSTNWATLSPLLWCKVRGTSYCALPPVICLKPRSLQLKLHNACDIYLKVKPLSLQLKQCLWVWYILNHCHCRWNPTMPVIYLKPLPLQMKQHLWYILNHCHCSWNDACDIYISLS